jgi:hypothetical protein
MSTIFGILGLIVTFIGMVLPPISALFPKINLHVYHKQRSIRRILYAAGALCAIAAGLLGSNPFTWIALALVAIFILVGEFILLPHKVIPPLDKPASSLAFPDDFTNDSMLIGVVVKENSRAYPLSVLTPHHIVNEEIGETPILAAYCPACRSGYIFDPVVKGKRLTFEPVTVRRRNMVMKDRETGSVWQHETGACLMGELKGEQLELLPSELCNWKSWVAEHPETTLCTRPEGYRHPSPLGHIFEKLLDRGPEHMIGPGVHKMDKRLEGHGFVIGMLVDGTAKAYPLKKLMEQGSITDKIGDIPIRLTYEQKADRVRAFQGEAGEEAIPVVRQWWLAWSEYHPESELFE